MHDGIWDASPARYRTARPHRQLESGGSELKLMEDGLTAKAAERDERQREAGELAAQARDLATEKEIKVGGEMRELQKTVDELQLK